MTELIFKQECHKIVGCAMKVLNTVGHGFHEKIYENDLVVDFKIQGIPAVQQPEFPIMYKSVELGRDAMFTRATMVISSLPPETCSRNVDHSQIYRASMPALVGCKCPKRREAWHPVVFSFSLRSHRSTHRAGKIVDSSACPISTMHG